MSVTVVNKSGAVPGRWDDASRLGLAAAVNVLKTAVLKEFGSDYYKGGAFRSTLQVKQSVRSVGPYKTPSGWEAILGTKLIEALYWELGHRNHWMKVNGQPTYQRVRIWEPAGISSTSEMRSAYGRVVARVMGRA